MYFQVNMTLVYIDFLRARLTIFAKFFGVNRKGK